MERNVDNDVDSGVDRDMDVTAYLADGDIDYILSSRGRLCPSCEGVLVKDRVTSCMKVNGTVMEYEVLRCESCGKVAEDNG
jgi:uncharacterized protein with PIN domain